MMIEITYTGQLKLDYDWIANDRLKFVIKKWFVSFICDCVSMLNLKYYNEFYLHLI